MASPATSVSDLERAEHIPMGAGTGLKRTVIYSESNGSYADITVQNPLPVDGDSVYAKDVDITNSSMGDFSGVITDLFDSRTSTIVATADNPSLTIALKRPIFNREIGLVTSSGNFSNVTIVAKNAAGATLETIDDSANNTKYTSHQYNLTTIDKWCVLEISFTTTDTVTLSFLSIYKSIHTDAHLHALKPDGTVTAIDATAGGNLKVSIEEFESGANPVRTNMEGGGYVTVGATAVELTFTGETNTIHIESKLTNTGIIWIGKSNVTSTGANSIASLNPGESIDISYDDSSNAVYAVSILPLNQY